MNNIIILTHGEFPDILTRGLSMATRAKPEWELFHGYCTAAGDRNVLILGSIGHPPSPDIVPHTETQLSDEDRRKLTNQGVPRESHSDDLSIIQARVKLDKTYELVGVEVSRPGKEISRNYILKRIGEFLKNTTKAGGKTRCIHRILSPRGMLPNFPVR